MTPAVCTRSRGNVFTELFPSNCRNTHTHRKQFQAYVYLRSYVIRALYELSLDIECLSSKCVASTFGQFEYQHTLHTVFTCGYNVPL